MTAGREELDHEWDTLVPRTPLLPLSWTRGCSWSYGRSTIHDTMFTVHIEDILGSRGKVAVLRVLANVSVPLSIRQVAEQAGMAHSPTGQVLDALVEAGVVATSQAGRSRIHWLERRSLAVQRLVLPLLAAEEELEGNAIQTLQAAIPPGTYSALLFGSRARGDAVRASDFDLLVVEPDEQTLRRTLAHLDRQATELRATLGAPVSVLGYTIEAALAQAERDEGFMTNAVREGLVLAGVGPANWGQGHEGAED